MRTDANQIAYNVVESILDAAHPFTLQVAGTEVAVSVTRGSPSSWPEDGFDGVSRLALLPAPVRAECIWPGGQVTLFVDYLREHYAHYKGNVSLRVASATRWLLVVNVKVALEDSADGERASLMASTSLLKRGSQVQPELNRVLQRLVSSSGLTMRRSKAELAKIRLPDGAIDGGAEAAFERAVLVALLKLEFSDRVSSKARGTPLVDLARLEMSPEALAALATTGDDSEEDAGDADDGEEDALARVRRRVERAVPDEADRRAALELLAQAVENAHDERPSGWHMNDRGNGLWLVTGRIAACRIARGTMALSVMGPISPETRVALGAEEEENEAWKAIPGGLYLKFPASKAGVALELLKEPFDRFVDEAMARMRRKLDPDSHVPEAVTYLAEAVGRPLPQPELGGPEPVESEGDDVGEDEVPSKEPSMRGRSPIFDKSHRSVSSLLSDIEHASIALPDLQRPFVWEDTKVRDLLDSLFVGYPTGTVVLWRTDDARDAHKIGSDAKANQASALVIDGQQRLTSLYAVLKGVEVQGKDGGARRIRISFRPRDGKFAVHDATIAQDPEWLPDVSELWSPSRTRQQIRRSMLDTLKAKGHEVDDKYADAVEHNLERLAAIDKFEFPLVEIRKDANDEDVADIFVRINNQGTKLGQADFVLTLLSVYHGPLRDKIEQRATEISKSSVVGVDTQQLLRAACAVGFERARMSAIYKFLRGADPSSGENSVAKRSERLQQLDEAAASCLEPTTWRDYLLRVAHAGFVHHGLVASQNAVVNAFAFYVKGRKAGLEKHRLDRLISRWVFGTLLTARYSGSSETVFEADLIRVRGLGTEDGDRFARTIDDVLNEAIGGDYWSRTLVSDLRTQRGRAPSALAFRAAQIVLRSRALFSDQSLQDFLTPGPSATKSASEHRHLFPKAWLVKKGITDRREINQVANLADVGWTENNEIGASAPASYVPRLREKFGLDDNRWGRMCAEHALPLGWENLSYEVFLEQRRQRMADIIRAAFRSLGGEEDSPPITPPWFLPGAEMVWSRIVETERALRGLVRDVYARRFEAGGAAKIEAAIPAPERESLARALRSRPVGSDPMSVVDYLYIAQLPPLLFSNDVWQDAKTRLGNSPESKQRLNAAIGQITPVRNEIAHVREVSPERLQKANVACGDVLSMIGRT